MSIEVGSSAMQMALFVNNLIFRGKMHICKENKRVFLLDSSMSDFFTIGRDVNKEPYIGIPEALLPFWADLSWSEVALDIDHGYAYMVARSLESQEMLLAVGIKVRTKRFAAFQAPIEKGVLGRVVNFKKLMVNVVEGETKVMLSDEHIYTGLTITNVSSPVDLSSGVYDEEYANTLLSNAGLDESYSVFKSVV